MSGHTNIIELWDEIERRNKSWLYRHTRYFRVLKYNWKYSKRNLNPINYFLWKWRKYVVHSYERMRKGYSFYDVCGFDHHLAKVIVGGVTELRRINHGYPGNITHEEWLVILDKIIEGFQAFIDYDGWFSAIDEGSEEAEAKYHEAFELLHKWFAALWD